MRVLSRWQVGNEGMQGQGHFQSLENQCCLDGTWQLLLTGFDKALNCIFDVCSRTIDSNEKDCITTLDSSQLLGQADIHQGDRKTSSHIIPELHTRS